MCRCDIGHVKRWVLAHKNDIKIRQCALFHWPAIEVIANFIPEVEAVTGSLNFTLGKGQHVRRVAPQMMSTTLRLQAERETGVTANIDRRNGIHLNGNGKTHLA